MDDRESPEHVEPEFVPLWYAAIKVLEDNAADDQDPRKESAAQRSLEEEAA